MIYFLLDGWEYSAEMTEHGLAVYDSNGVEVFDIYTVEQGYRAYEAQEAA